MNHGLPSILPGPDPMELEERLLRAIPLACHWLGEVAINRQRQPGEGEGTLGMLYDDWRGAIRGEYSAARGQWSYFCPYWHSAQAAVALLECAPWAGDFACQRVAEEIGGFLLRNRVALASDRDAGLLLAYEDSPDTINTSAILESIRGLLALGDATGRSDYQQAALGALGWVADHAYRGGGLFENSYDRSSGQFALVSGYRHIPSERRRRPLADDAAFLRGYLRGGEQRWETIFLETVERLLASEFPAGNWLRYLPCNLEAEQLHPRHAYWWGNAMVDAWLHTGDERFREAAFRSANWYSHALRRDGGLFRHTSVGFNTESFGHATSGSACAAILFLRVAKVFDEERYLPYARKALDFCLKMQLVSPRDPHLRGAILEKVLPPDGSDRSPYHLRDLGTIFFLQAAAAYLHQGSVASVREDRTPVLEGAPMP